MSAECRRLGEPTQGPMCSCADGVCALGVSGRDANQLSRCDKCGLRLLNGTCPYCADRCPPGCPRCADAYLAAKEKSDA